MIVTGHFTGDKENVEHQKKACFYLVDHVPKRCFVYPEPNNPFVKKYCFFAVGGYGNHPIKKYVKCTLLNDWMHEERSMCQAHDFTKLLLELV